MVSGGLAVLDNSKNIILLKRNFPYRGGRCVKATTDDMFKTIHQPKLCPKFVLKKKKADAYVFVEQLQLPRGGEDTEDYIQFKQLSVSPDPKAHEGVIVNEECQVAIKSFFAAQREFKEETNIELENFFISSCYFTLNWVDDNKFWQYNMFVAITNLHFKQKHRADATTINISKNKNKRIALENEYFAVGYSNYDDYVTRMKNDELKLYGANNYVDFFQFIDHVYDNYLKLLQNDTMSLTPGTIPLFTKFPDKAINCNSKKICCNKTNFYKFTRNNG